MLPSPLARFFELQLLLDQLSCINDDDTECIMSISTKYAELLKASENHIPIDLYRLKISSTDSDFMLSSEEKRSYYCQLVWGYMWRAVLILLPIIAAVLYLFLLPSPQMDRGIQNRGMVH